MAEVTGIAQKNIDAALQLVRDMQPIGLAIVMVTQDQVVPIIAGNMDMHMMLGALETAKFNLLCHTAGIDTGE